MTAAQHTPGRQWCVMDWAQRYWFGQDETTARTYLELMAVAFGMKPGIDVFIGRETPPPHIVKHQAERAAKAERSAS